jgi:hypothetical protein
MKLPPLTQDDGKREPCYGIRFETGRYTLELTDEGGGAYLEMSTEPGEKFRLEVAELDDLAKWARESVAELDEWNSDN